MEEGGRDSIQKKWFIDYMLFELKEQGIDITQDDYIKNPAFIKLKKEFVHVDGIKITKSWWIEKNIVGQERLKRIYGKYALGTEHTFSLCELDNNVWIKDLVDALGQDELDEYAIERYLYRNEKDKLGLIYRLQKLGINLQKFDNCGEKIKLLFFLCCFEKKQGIEILPFLSNSTLENVDNSIVGDYTRNGELIYEIKMNIEKEISQKYLKDSTQELIKIALEWQTVMERILVMLDVDVQHQSSNKKEWERIKSQIEIIVGMFDGERIIEYKDSIMETFYLKILQHESIGRERDILDIEEMIQQKLDVLDPVWHDKYKILSTEIVTENRLKDFIKENRKRLVNYVFQKDKVTSNDYKKFDVAVAKIGLYMDILRNNTSWNRKGGFSVLLIVSFIQETINSFNKEKTDNRFYHHQSADLKTLNSELYNGRAAFRKNQIAIIEKIRYRYNYNLGRGEEADIVNKILGHLDYLMKKIYQTDSLENMQKFHSYLLLLVNTAITRNEEIERRIKVFSDIALAKSVGYRISIDTIVKQFFGGILGRMPFYDNLAEQVGEFLQSVENINYDCKKVWPFEITTFPYICLEGYAYFIADPVHKLLILDKLRISVSDDTRLILFQEGYSVGVCLE